MYERNRGSKRLATELMGIANDPQKLKALAKGLNYYPEQLKDDIIAIYKVAYNDPDD